MRKRERVVDTVEDANRYGELERALAENRASSRFDPTLSEPTTSTPSYLPLLLSQPPALAPTQKVVHCC